MYRKCARLPLLLAIFVVILLNVCAPRPLRADIPTEKKRALMATVKRVVVVPAFFATDTISKAEANRKSNGSDAGQPAPNSNEARQEEYAGQLRKLTEHVCSRLPGRVTARTPFTVVPADETIAALKTLGWTPDKLFQNGGRMRGARYPTPDPDAVKKLAANLHADAVLLTALDEPRRKNSRYIFNFLTGVDYRNAQVEARGGFYVVMADGTTVVYDDVDVAHPLTHIGKKEYLMVDWTEAQDVMIEDLLDEWVRYTPEK
jgi:hypothetical protein